MQHHHFRHCCWFRPRPVAVLILLFLLTITVDATARTRTSGGSRRGNTVPKAAVSAPKPNSAQNLNLPPPRRKLAAPPATKLFAAANSAQQSAPKCTSERPSWLTFSQDWPLTVGGLLAENLNGLTAAMAGMSSFSNNKNNFSLGRVIRRIVDMAVSDIAAHPCVLKGYKFSIESEDTQCEPSTGMKILFETMSGKIPKLALFGAACSSVNEPVAMTAKYFHMVQLSYTETHPKFTVDKESYNYFYSVVPAFRNFHLARVHLLNHFNWTRVGIIVQRDDARYALPQEEVQNALETKFGIKVEVSVGFSYGESKIHDELIVLKKRDVRIIIGFFNASTAGDIFCQARKLGLTGAANVWLLASYENDDWLKFSTSNCTDEEMLDAVNGHFMLTFASLRSDNDTVINKKSVENFRHRYRQLCRSPECDQFKFYGYVYDGVWTLALAMERLIIDNALFKSQKFDAVTDFWDHGVMQEEWGTRLLDSLNSTNFEGVTGTVRFDGNQRLGIIKIAQFQNESYATIGTYDSANEYFTLKDYLIFWKGGFVPSDRIDFIVERRYIDFAVFCITSSFTVICIMAAVWFLFVNIYFRDHRFIKMSSPNINNMIVAGSILTYLSVILLGLDTRMISEQAFGYICTAKVWTLSFGFTLAFGAMFSKTWRVHSIFTNIKLNKKAIQDYKLFLIVFVLLLIDFLILTSWLIVDRIESIERTLPTETYLEKNLKIEPKIESCHSQYTMVFQGLLLGFKGIQLISGCFLAWETRHVNVPALNDSKYIGASVYNVVVMCALGVPISFVLKDHINASYVLISIFIIFCTTLTLALVFIPKVVELIRNPKSDSSDHRFRQTMMTSAKNAQLQRHVSLNSIEDFKERLERADKDNVALKQMLEDKINELQRLTKLLENGDSKSIPNGKPAAKMVFSDDDPYGGVFLGFSGGSNGNGTGTVDGNSATANARKRSDTIRIDSHAYSPVDINETTSLIPHHIATSNGKKGEHNHHHHHHRHISSKLKHLTSMEQCLNEEEDIVDDLLLDQGERRRSSTYQSLIEMESTLSPVLAQPNYLMTNRDQKNSSVETALCSINGNNAGAVVGAGDTVVVRRYSDSLDSEECGATMPLSSGTIMPSARNSSCLSTLPERMWVQYFLDSWPWSFEEDV